MPLKRMDYPDRNPDLRERTKSHKGLAEPVTRIGTGRKLEAGSEDEAQKRLGGLKKGPCT